MFWAGTSERFRWNLAILAALALEPVAMYARKLGAPTAVSVACSLLAIALSVLYFWAVVYARHHVSGPYKPTERPVVFVIGLALLVGGAVGLYLTVR